MSKQRLKAIIEKILAGNATAEEVAEISNAIQQDHVRQVVEDIHGLLNRSDNERFLYDEEKWDAISEKILKSDEVEEENSHRNKITGSFKKMSVAIAILASLAVGIYFIIAKSNHRKVAGIGVFYLACFYIFRYHPDAYHQRRIAGIVHGGQ